MSDDAFFDPERPRLCKATVTYHSNLQFQDRLSYIDKRYDHLRRLTQTLKRKINDLECPLSGLAGVVGSLLDTGGQVDTKVNLTLPTDAYLVGSKTISEEHLTTSGCHSPAISTITTRVFLKDIMRQDNDEENMEQIKALIEDIKREKQLMRDEAHIIRGELSQAMYNEDLRSHLLNFIAEFEDTWQETPKKRLTGEYREEQERRRQSTSQGEDDVYTPSSSDDQTYRETSF
ncbi:unnamed protein product [Haemonchus placei]|uniref:Uncharacterized protein n=1 Tax=Haemonchus placei TaxID=6290 RepID=A0A0N4VTP1_HAEPC|nr:unnamed protein product [Haemonchus placei]